MKVRLMAEITDDSGKKVIAPIEIEREIPSIEEFGAPSEFYETFDRYERPVLEARAELSFGDAVRILNRQLHRKEDEAIKGRTYQDFCQRNGQKLTDYVEKNTKKILEQARFDSKTGKPYDEVALAPMLKEAGRNLPATADMQQAIQTFNAFRQRSDEQIQVGAFEMEVQEETCYVSIDDIGVKHQKEHRKGSQQKQGAYVWNTVAVVQSETP